MTRSVKALVIFPKKISNKLSINQNILMNENSINNEKILIMVKNNKLRIFSLYIIKINKVYLIESYDV